jgi:H+/Cl- antiporter ClcA
MGAILGGTMRSPLTGVVFALELTHDVNMMLPLLVATSMAHAFTVLTLRRSILTEKISRRASISPASTRRIRWRSCSCAR